MPIRQGGDGDFTLGAGVCQQVSKQDKESADGGVIFLSTLEYMIARYATVCYNGVG